MKGRSHSMASSEPPDDWVDGSWTVDCVCGVNFDDGEEMVNCDECGVWVHTRCSRFVKGEKSFACDKCKSKNSRNDSEETEVAQLLVELPTKTIKMENSCPPPACKPSRRPLRLWTDMPIEERVHVQGKPGGDPALFPGLSSVFTPELWKCTGYVPKKFNFRYREFPCWEDKKEKVGTNIEEENESMVDKGAGVLFALSKETVLASPVGTLVGMRGQIQGGRYDRKTSLKNPKRWETEGLDVRLSENAVRKEGSLIRPSMINSGKRKKEDSGSSKDRSGKKKARTADKQTCNKSRRMDGLRTAANEDRDSMGVPADTQRVMSRNSKDGMLRENASNRCIAVDSNVENSKNHLAASQHLSKGLSTDMSRDKVSIGSGLKEENAGHQASARNECSREAGVFQELSLEGHDVKSVSLAADSCDGFHKCDDEKKNSKNSTKKASLGAAMTDIQKLETPFGGPICAKPEVKDSQISLEDSNNHMPPIVGHHDVRVKNEVENDGARGVLEAMSSVVVNVKFGGLPQHSKIYSNHMPANSKTNVTSSEHEVEDANAVSEAVGACHKEKANELSSTPPFKQELEGSELLNDPAESKPSGLGDEKLRLVNSKSDDYCNNGNKELHGATDVLRDEDGHKLPKKLVKHRIKSSANSDKITLLESKDRIKSSANSDKITLLESKDPSISVSSIASSLQNIGSGDFSGTLQNKITGSGSSQRGEKFNQAMHPPASSVCPATLSDEELALLLHQELNSSPRVPRVPRVRHAGSLPQLTSPTATSMLIKRTSSSGSRDHASLLSKRKSKDVSKDDDGKKTQRGSSSHDQKREDSVLFAKETTTKKESDRKTISSNGPASSFDGRDQSVSSMRYSPRNISDDDTANIGGPRHRTLPGLINEIMSKGSCMTYEELCDAVLPHWQNLRKHNGERYAYSSHSQAVLDCLRNRNEWAHLVDRGPKTNASRKRRKLDAEPLSFELEDGGYCGRRRTSKEVEGGYNNALESHGEEFPKGKRKARKRRRLALQGRRVKDVRKRIEDDDDNDDDDDDDDDENGPAGGGGGGGDGDSINPLSNSSEEITFSDEEEAYGGGEASASSDEMQT